MRTTILLLFQTRASGSDEARIEWLRKNAVPVRSIAPDDGEFSDLQPLKKVLGDVRVVLLGEPEEQHASSRRITEKETLP